MKSNIKKFFYSALHLNENTELQYLQEDNVWCISFENLNQITVFEWT